MKRMALGIATAMLLAGTAFAAEGHWQPGQPQTRAEARARAEHLFDKLDLNHDGKLDQADRAARINEMFDRIDTNHDGVISRAEFAQAHEKMHERMMGAEHGGMDHPGMGGNDEGGHMGHGGHIGHGERAGLVMLILHRADPGHTGIVTRDAFVRAALSLFDQADTNHDGVLTPGEHRAFAQAMRQQMQARWQQHSGSGEAMPAH